MVVPVKMHKFIHAFRLSEVCRILLKKVILEKKICGLEQGKKKNQVTLSLLVNITSSAVMWQYSAHASLPKRRLNHAERRWEISRVHTKQSVMFTNTLFYSSLHIYMFLGFFSNLIAGWLLPTWQKLEANIPVTIGLKAQAEVGECRGTLNINT